MNFYDIIIIGAGSVGTPLAMFLAEKKKKVLIIDSLPSAGQGQNKAAIGGIRATHSDGSKIKIGLESIEIFSNWKKKTGIDIGWMKNGYCFPIYGEHDEMMLKEMLKVQQSHGLNIRWINKKEIVKLAPGINEKDLRGGTYSPDDGSASPLLALNVFYEYALKSGAIFKFNEKVISILKGKNIVKGVLTDKEKYFAPIVVNAAGAYAREISKTVDIDIPVMPDCHEAGITEPVLTGIKPMIVDIMPGLKSKNYYFYSNSENQIIFCLTPSPAIWGDDRDSTSQFLPEISQRMIQLIPKLANIKVRRVWRGLYPMTPDGFPIVDFSKRLKGYVLAAGMCGQGFMLGPGLGKVLSNIIAGDKPKENRARIKGFELNRKFEGQEKLK
ncbi:MAG: FAD-binding oxidoreductase [Elusimicrobia bacterium]|nr:FAD-binding oxidoreductase [Elusimicrobiota bacterium]